jgi:hypothetical protein
MEAGVKKAFRLKGKPKRKATNLKEKVAVLGIVKPFVENREDSLGVRDFSLALEQGQTTGIIKTLSYASQPLNDRRAL